jgi:exodeoxyribonuclease VII small subunit
LVSTPPDNVDAVSAEGPIPAPAGYAAALAELETILAELEDDHVDVDALAAKVKRASALIEWCRGRIEAARVEVTRVVGGTDPPPPQG